MNINQTIRNANATVQGGECAKQSDYTQIIFPKPDSVKGRVLGALLRGEQLTHLDCWRRFGSARLSHHIYMLSNEGGWPVQMVEQEVKTSDAGRTASIGIYTLPEEAITSAGDAGQRTSFKS